MRVRQMLPDCAVPIRWARDPILGLGTRPFRNRLRVLMRVPGKGSNALLRRLYRLADCRCRRCAGVARLSRSASSHPDEATAPHGLRSPI